MTAAAVLKACLAIIFREIWSRRSTVHISPLHANHKKVTKMTWFFLHAKWPFSFDWLAWDYFFCFSIMQSIDGRYIDFTQSEYSNQDQFCQLIMLNFSLKCLNETKNSDDFSVFTNLEFFFFWNFVCFDSESEHSGRKIYNQNHATLNSLLMCSHTDQGVMYRISLNNVL